MQRIEEVLSNSLRLYKTINDTFDCTTLNSEWHDSYRKQVKSFNQIKNNFEIFLASVKDADLHSQQRDILWIMEFAYRDFSNSFALFEQITEKLNEELKHKDLVSSKQQEIGFDAGKVNLRGKILK